MKKYIYLIVLLVVLSGCGQLHPKVDSQALQQSEGYSQHVIFDISPIDFETQLLATTLFIKIPDEEFTYQYQSAEIILTIQSINDKLATIQMIFEKARPLQNKQYTVKAHQALSEVLAILEPKAYSSEELQDILTIRTITELHEGKTVRLSETTESISMVADYGDGKTIYSVIFRPIM